MEFHFEEFLNFLMKFRERSSPWCNSRILETGLIRAVGLPRNEIVDSPSWSAINSAFWLVNCFFSALGLAPFYSAIPQILHRHERLGSRISKSFPCVVDFKWLTWKTAFSSTRFDIIWWYPTSSCCFSPPGLLMIIAVMKLWLCIGTFSAF